MMRLLNLLIPRSFFFPPPVNCLPEILTLGKTGILKTLDFSVDIVDFLVFLIDAAGVV